MATRIPDSRPAEGSLNGPRSPNGLTDTQGDGRPEAGSSASGSSVPGQQDETTGERIGRFFRRAMERISRHDEDWRRDNPRRPRDRDTEERYREGDPSWQYGRSSLRDREPNFRAGSPGDARDARLTAGRQGGSRFSYGQGTYARPSFGQGQSSQGGYGRTEEDPGTSLGQRALGHSPGESSGLPEIPETRPGVDRGFEPDPAREEWHRDRGEMFRDRDRGQGRSFWQREPLAARDVMTRNPTAVTRQGALREAALVMRDENCGVVPVVDAGGRLEGILTDRDVAVRGVVSDSFAQLRVQDVMTDDVSAVTPDEPLTSVLDLMGRKQVRRVPVVDRDDRLLGIISMGDIANRADYDEDLQDAFARISSRRSFWSLFS